METRAIISTLKEEAKEKREDILFKRKLFTALRYAKHSCPFGSSNKIEAYFRTNGYISFIDSRNNKGKYIKGQHRVNINYDGMYQLKETRWWYNPTVDSQDHIDIFSRHADQHPLLDEKFDLNIEQSSLLIKALLTLQEKYGNCLPLSNLIVKYLWENSAGINKIELVSTDSFDHVFVIVNRTGELLKPETWGNAWIIDPWYKNGVFYHASEFKEMITKIKQYAKEQLYFLCQNDLATHLEKFKDLEDVNCILKCVVEPQKNPYPTYSTIPFYPLEYYYRVDVQESPQPSRKDAIEYKKKLNSCLSLIKSSNFFLKKTTPPASQPLSFAAHEEQLVSCWKLLTDTWGACVKTRFGMTRKKIYQNDNGFIKILCLEENIDHQTFILRFQFSKDWNLNPLIEMLNKYGFTENNLFISKFPITNPERELCFSAPANEITQLAMNIFSILDYLDGDNFLRDEIIKLLPYSTPHKVPSFKK